MAALRCCSTRHCSRTDLPGASSTTTGTVLMKSPTIVSTPARSCGRPETTVPNATSRRSVSRPNTTAHANCSTVFRVRPCSRAQPVNRAVAAPSSDSAVRCGTTVPSREWWASASMVGLRSDAA